MARSIVALMMVVVIMMIGVVAEKVEEQVDEAIAMDAEISQSLRGSIMNAMTEQERDKSVCWTVGMTCHTWDSSFCCYGCKGAGWFTTGNCCDVTAPC